jgi:hypothetical protein
MSYEPGSNHEFSVTSAWISGDVGKSDGSLGVYSRLWLTMEVKTADQNTMTFKGDDDTRKLTGTAHFMPAHEDDVCDGSWGFFKEAIPDKFDAEIQLRAEQIERIWNVYLANPNGFRLIILGPPITELRQGFAGGFKIRFSTYAE